MKKLVNRMRVQLVLSAFVASLVSFPTSATAATPRQLAVKLHNLLAGTNPSTANLAEMERLLMANDKMAAAAIATNQDNFINVTVRSYFAPMSNAVFNPVTRLNAFIATGMGFVRDNRPYTEIVTANVTYRVGATPADYNAANDTHYLNAENRNANLARELVAFPNQGRGTGYTDGAGLLTVDSEFRGNRSFDGGTNRRAYERAVYNFLGKPLDEFRISGLQTDRIRRDVSRDNAGNVNLFPKECSTCHTHMDPADSAFNCYDANANGSPIFPTGACTTNRFKATVNQTPPGFYESGYVEGSLGRTDDFELRNPLMGWKRAGGKGAREFGQAIAETDLFSENAVIRVWSIVCVNQELTDAEKVTMGKYFRGPLGYNLRSLFQYIATLPKCLGVIGGD